MRPQKSLLLAEGNPDVFLVANDNELLQPNLDGYGWSFCPALTGLVGSRPEITFVKPAEQSTGRIFIPFAMNVTHLFEFSK